MEESAVFALYVKKPESLRPAFFIFDLKYFERKPNSDDYHDRGDIYGTNRREGTESIIVCLPWPELLRHCESYLSERLRYMRKGIYHRHFDLACRRYREATDFVVYGKSRYFR